MLEIENVIPLLLQASSSADGATRLKRVVLLGDHMQLPPVVRGGALRGFSNMDQSLFSRFVRLGVPVIQLNQQGRCRGSLRELFAPFYPQLGDLAMVKEIPLFHYANPGFTYEYQFLDVGDYMGHGESAPTPHYYQNLGEAEYVVAMYQYMRLQGYPAESIAILTTYNGQKDLINDVLEQRCAWNQLFGKPKVSTVDQFQGQQCDCMS